MKLNISLGKSRNDKSWKNKEILWTDFLDKIKVTHRTAETVAEYLSFTPARQAEIKDIGGFVGGHLAGGRRLKGSVTSRSFLTFDVDEALPGFWQKFCLLYDCNAAIYSTHKHTPEKPRYRLLIPITREVLCDEYTAIVRRIAGDLGIEQFDHTGYELNRLMYWPSTSRDGVYEYQHQSGPYLNPDDVLSTYKNWQDVSQWPLGLREKKVQNNDLKKQGEPTEKPGLIGAFNRAYTIAEAIELFLAEVYEACDAADRYTFLEGSTAAGVVVYDNKFTYSHHSTDPTSGQLCSAFDLVRLHKYGLLDTDEETPVNKRPSFVAMCDFVAKDKKVKQQLGEAKLQLARDAFSGYTAAEEVEPDFDFLKEMDVDRKGNYLATINNVALILEHDPVFKDNIAFDLFRQQAIFKHNVPWRKLDGRPQVNDNDLANIENYIEKVYKLMAGSKLQKGLLVVYEKNSFHPIVNYLKGLVWDGNERLNTLLPKYLGAANSDYVRTVTRKALVACVARVMQPGVKFDNVLTLVGEEGQGKSMLWDKLGGAWFSDTFNLHMLQTKEAYEQIQGVWIIEIGELAGMAKAEVERVKGFISARQDNYRSPYGRTTEQRLRQCVFFASTNTTDFLKSQTGNRRFWPVATFEVKPAASPRDLTAEEIGQIWAEAFDAYINDEQLYLDADIIAQAKEVQEFYTEENPLVNQIENFLTFMLPDNWYDMLKYDKLDFLANYDKENIKDLKPRTKVCKYEIWELVMQERGPINTQGWRMIDAAMQKIKGWAKVKEYVRFGNHYPRHRGSFEKMVTIKDLIN